MAKYKVLMTDTIFPGVDLETETLAKGRAAFVLASAKDPETLMREGADADGLIVVYAEITPEICAALKKCRIIVRTGIGYNNVNIEAAARCGIKVANVPDYCQGEVADHTVALFLALARQIPHYLAQVRGGGWSAVEVGRVPRLQGQVFGLLGCGFIGGGVAERVRPFGLKPVTFDPYASEAMLRDKGIERITDFDAFLGMCDYISVHTPLTPETERIINARTLAKMKPTAIVINTARGPLIDQDALYDALKNGVIGGAALDVLATEPPARPLKLAELPNCLITPHAAFMSDGAMPELRIKAAQEVVRTLETGTPKFWVNKALFG